MTKAVSITNVSQLATMDKYKVYETHLTVLNVPEGSGLQKLLIY
jgi:hypothetical protein